MTANVLSGDIHGFRFHELRQHLPRVALFLDRFDDGDEDDEESFDTANDHTLTTTANVQVSKMIAHVDIYEHISNKGMKVFFDPGMAVKVASVVKHDKDVSEHQNGKSS